MNYPTESISSIFSVIADYQEIASSYHNELISKFYQKDLALLVQQTFYNISNRRDKIMLYDLYKFLKSKKIFFNITNLQQAFLVYDLDRDNALTLKEFSDILNISITPDKYITKSESSNEFIRIVVSLLTKDFEMFEALEKILKDLYSNYPSFDPGSLFDSIASGKQEILLSDLEPFLSKVCNVQDPSNSAKLILMKMNNNIVSSVYKDQFCKFFNLIQPKNIELVDTSTFTDASAMITEILTRSQSGFLKVQSNYRKIEYEMFDYFIKFILEKDKNLSSILGSESHFNCSALYNHITGHMSEISFDNFIKRLCGVFSLITPAEELIKLFDRYKGNKFYMSFIQFTKMLKADVSNADLKSSIDSYEKMSAGMKAIISRAIKTMIENEIEIEKLRKKLNRMNQFNIREMFNCLSHGGMSITAFDFAEYFGLSKEDGVVVARRFDSDNDGKVSYDDFVKELFPSII